MAIKEACQSILNQVSEVIEQISDDDFTRPVLAFNGATVGQHFRHALEFFQCLMNGVDTGIVSYDKRQHDKGIETSKLLALDAINKSSIFMEHCDLDKTIELQVSYHQDNDSEVLVSSNMAREITYNIEHMVHHMALVKIGIKEVCPYVNLPSEFGVAISTIKYHKNQAEG